MIFDNIKNIKLYTSISPRVKTALEYLSKTDFSKITAGKYELDGNNIFVLVQEYQTIPREQGKWEFHKNYIDIQYIYEGVEQMGFGDVDTMKTSVPYDAGNDIAFVAGEGDFATVGKDSYCIFFPNDAHMPKVAVNNVPSKIKKILLKVKIA
jgi:YhcH/YjgK/YiaL family protein